MKSAVTVLGAGIVGVSCALELQRRGYQVNLIDRRGPGEETSAGNAGILSYSNVTPLASPELLSRMHRLMLNRETDLLLHYPHLPLLLPWLARFLWRCRRETYLSDGDAMGVLTSAPTNGARPATGFPAAWSLMLQSPCRPTAQLPSNSTPT